MKINWESIFTRLSIIAISLYLLGFLIWNIVLYSLRYDEIQILQSRFIYSGFFFIFFVSIFLGALILLFDIIKFILKFVIPLIKLRVLPPKINTHLSTILFKIKNPIESFYKQNQSTLKVFASSIMFTLFILIIFFYSIFIFPHLPRILGGGRPVFVSIMIPESSSPLNGSLIKAFGVKLADGGTETQKLCVVYENSEVLLVPLNDRFLRIQKSMIPGTVYLPDPKYINYEKNECTWLLGATLFAAHNPPHNSLFFKLYEKIYTTEEVRLSKLRNFIRKNPNKDITVELVVNEFGYTKETAEDYLNILEKQGFIFKNQ